MADLEEIGNAINVLTEYGTRKDDITVLHCNTEYPTPFEDVNLVAMLTIRDAFKVKVGYSDHTPGIEAPVAAVALGATVIEKHFTLDKDMKGPDHKASLEPDELKAMVHAIRNIEKALGNGIKKPSRSEMKKYTGSSQKHSRSKGYKKGEVLGEDNITVKRPAGGISPMEWDNVLGKKGKKRF